MVVKYKNLQELIKMAKRSKQLKAAITYSNKSITLYKPSNKSMILYKPPNKSITDRILY